MSHARFGNQKYIDSSKLKYNKFMDQELSY